MKNKKGISPFIAAVILIIVAVAVGVIVANFIRGYIGRQVDTAEDQETTQMACNTDVDFDVYAIDGIKEAYITSDGANISLMLQNTGTANISFIFKVFGDVILSSESSTDFGGSQIDVETDEIGNGGIKKYLLNINVSLTNMTSVDITPAFVTNGETVPCNDLKKQLLLSEFKTGSLANPDYSATQ